MLATRRPCDRRRRGRPPACVPPAARRARSPSSEAAARDASRASRSRRGLPRTTDALVAALARLSRGHSPARKGARSIAATLGDQASPVGGWEDRLIIAGRVALRAGKGLAASAPGAGAVSAGGDVNLGLEVPAPIQWLSDGQATGKQAEGFFGELTAGLRGLTTAPEATTTKGTLKASTNGETYSVELDTSKPAKTYCPKGKGSQGVVETKGTYKGRRTLTVGRQTQTETFELEYTVTGHVNRSAELTTYDIKVNLSGTDAAGQPFKLAGTNTGIKQPAIGDAIIFPSKVKLSAGARDDDLNLAVAATSLARQEGLKFLKNAQDEFSKTDGCVQVIETPQKVKRGTSATVQVRTINRITGKPVQSEVTSEPSGGAQVTPAKTNTGADGTTKLNVKMPAKGHGSSVGPVRAAAAGPAIAITTLSTTGRGHGRIGSDELPVSYKVELAATGSSEAYPNANAIRGDGTIHEVDATLIATLQGDGTTGKVTWKGQRTVAFSDLQARCDFANCPIICNVAAPVSVGGDWTVQIEADSDAGTVAVTRWVPTAHVTITGTCDNGAGPEPFSVNGPGIGPDFGTKLDPDATTAAPDTPQVPIEGGWFRFTSTVQGAGGLDANYDQSGVGQVQLTPQY